MHIVKAPVSEVKFHPDQPDHIFTCSQVSLLFLVSFILYFVDNYFLVFIKHIFTVHSLTD